MYTGIVQNTKILAATYIVSQNDEKFSTELQKGRSYHMSIQKSQTPAVPMILRRRSGWFRVGVPETGFGYSVFLVDFFDDGFVGFEPWSHMKLLPTFGTEVLQTRYVHAKVRRRTPTVVARLILQNVRRDLSLNQQQ